MSLSEVDFILKNFGSLIVGMMKTVYLKELGGFDCISFEATTMRSCRLAVLEHS